MVQLIETERLTDREEDLVRTLRTITKIECTTTFTSDTFRMHGLDRFIVDKQHGIGGFFRKLKTNGLAEEVGWTRSQMPTNHLRSIRVWKWK